MKQIRLLVTFVTLLIVGALSGGAQQASSRISWDI